MNGSIPVLFVSGRSLAEAWEKSLLALYQEGCKVKTQYDKIGDRLSRDSSMTIVIEDPTSEPLIHRAFPGGLADLEEYRQEVVDGVKDHWVRDPKDPTDTRWDYTYHGRLTAYDVPGHDDIPGGGERSFKPINQLDWLITSLVQCCYTRRANIITWQPWRDMKISDPPCLQSIWCRILPDTDDIWHLNMNVRFRSRDAYDAAFMNMFAFISLMKHIADTVSSRVGRPVKLGRYVDQSDSYHIYGSHLDAFEEGFLELTRTRTFDERTWTSAFAQPFFDEARPTIAKKIADTDGQRSAR